MKVAVIPARGGSKRVPRKNIRAFAGKPMIAWSIEAAKKSNLFERIIVSTDDDEIAKVATSWGAEVPFMRPPELSDDFTASTDVIAHAVDWLQRRKVELTAVCCVYATAPFVQAADIRRALEKLESGDWAFVFSATTYPSSVFRSFRENGDQGLEMLFPEHFHTRSQDLDEALHDAAQFYWGRVDAWLERKTVFGPQSSIVRIPSWRVQDIDTEEDWQRAELLAVQIGEHSGSDSRNPSGI